NAQYQNKKLNLLGLDNREEPEILNIKILAGLALADLVRRDIIKQSILLEKKVHLTCNLVIEGIVEGASSLVQTNSWMYWKK
ncbi:15179_t:CDS:1, partial [Gigaspora rosea]